MKKQRGYTLLELIFLVIVFGSLVGGGLMIWAITHFVNKYW